MGSWLTTACTSASLCVMSTTGAAVCCSSASARGPHSLACSQKLDKRRLRRSACVCPYTLCIRLYTPEARLAALPAAANVMGRKQLPKRRKLSSCTNLGSASMYACACTSIHAGMRHLCCSSQAVSMRKHWHSLLCLVTISASHMPYKNKTRDENAA
jgi:hypothetical protein